MFSECSIFVSIEILLILRFQKNKIVPILALIQFSRKIYICFEGWTIPVNDKTFVRKEK